MYRLAGTRFLHSKLIPPEALEAHRIPRSRLIPYRNLKEELSFEGIDIGSVEPHRFGTTTSSESSSAPPPRRATTTARDRGS